MDRKRNKSVQRQVLCFQLIEKERNFHHKALGLQDQLFHHGYLYNMRSCAIF